MRRIFLGLTGILALALGATTAGASPPPAPAAELAVVEQGFRWLGTVGDNPDTEQVQWGALIHNPNPDTWVAAGTVDVTFTGADGSVVGGESVQFTHVAAGDTQAVGPIYSSRVTAEPVAMAVDLTDVEWIAQADLRPGEVTATIATDATDTNGYRHVVMAIRSTLDTDAWTVPKWLFRDMSGTLLGVTQQVGVVPAGGEVGAEQMFFLDYESTANMTVSADVDWDGRWWAGETTNPPAGVLPLEVVEVGGGWYETTSGGGASWAALLRNPNGDNWVAETIAVVTTFRDADGRIIGADFNNGLNPAMPGQTIAVGTQLTYVPEAANIDVSAVATWAQFEGVLEPAVTFTDVTPQYEGGELSAVTAVMTVPADRVGNSLSLVLIYRDSGGRIVGGSTTGVTAEALTTSIEIPEYTHITDVATVDLLPSYTVSRPATPEPTPPGEPVAETGRFRPTGIFSPELTANIPAPSDMSTDPPVVYANLILAALAVLALTIGVRLLNTTLVAHEDALEGLIRPARALGAWWGRADGAVAAHVGRAAGLIRVGGVLLFYGVLFSFLEPGWRPWTLSGLFVLVVMTIAFGAVGTGDDLVEMRSARRWGLPARLVVKPALVLFAMGSVVLTKFAGLVPGLLIGTPEAFSMEDEVSERDAGRLAVIGLGSTAAIGVGAWALSTPLDRFLDGSGGFAQGAAGALVTLLVLIFAVAIENLFANLLAFPGSEGAAIRRRSRIGWWAAMIAVTALFFHTLINPAGDLADSMRSTNVRVVLITVGVFLLFSIAVWGWFHRRDDQRPLAGIAPNTPAPVVLEPPEGEPVGAPGGEPVEPAPAPRELVRH